MAEAERITPIDWDNIYHRLKTTQAAGEQAGPEETRRILRARARQLALEPRETTSDFPCVAVVEFWLASEIYCVELSAVREIFPLRELTPVPCTPPFVLGLINIRGQLLSVIDIKKFFQLPEKGLTELNKVIVVSIEGFEIGLLADAVLGVKAIPLSEIQPSVHLFTGVQAEYLKGVTGERAILLDIQRLVMDRQLIISEQVDG
ncbi:MAG: purine-binding chemotaxis protein CheW [Acidobacteria bacterium]|nr:purine-binding chemotaxis protein CheW [Acidobacteriota bacterium]